ncbi:MAG: (d)CMP kinase [Anaerolineae bacterium]|nr:(d)CMP kinase [Anaerolineae bacterium]
MKPSTIAIDGPAASGKSTVAERVAHQLGYLYLDTGVMYRAVTWAAIQRNVPLEDEAAVTDLARALHIDVVSPSVDDGRQYTVLTDGVDVTWDIRRPAVDANVSLVSTYRGVRAEMVRQQRRVAQGGRIVMVGRDIGSVVLPDADLKIYMDAAVEERARRRWLELQERSKPMAYDDVLAMMRSRDQIDSQRDISPLCIPAGAVVFDTTELSAEEVLAQLLALIERQGCPADE